MFSEDYQQVVVAILNVALCPYGLLLFFVCFHGNRFFVPTGMNTTKLKKLPYFIYIIIYTAVVLGITYAIGFFTVDDFNIWMVYQPKYYWLSFVAWGITAFTIREYFRGMEGNIMGFIFFPMLFFSSLALFVVNIADLFSFLIEVFT
ncbi:hypothetical protein OOZ15_18555 [Galbibacter sp. EGI 63066]|uniref:hypothetical protein n=1 Tax=Galbibacter sp. EGI 63066 TaxID=2993559 RepID=UPI0022496A88|nr:hypothetical protein [Galbibacter sp. EGI 63066]MCX2681959.1 hypothetical protein [Galbibacter sp. EGI 63066]